MTFIDIHISHPANYLILIQIEDGANFVFTGITILNAKNEFCTKDTVHFYQDGFHGHFTQSFISGKRT